MNPIHKMSQVSNLIATQLGVDLVRFEYGLEKCDLEKSFLDNKLRDNSRVNVFI